MIFFKRILDFFLFSNLFISVCAAAMTIATYLLIQPLMEFVRWEYVGFVFFSTLALYNFPSVMGAGFSSGNSERHTWLSRNKKMLSAFFFLNLIASGVLACFFPFTFILWLLPAVVISFAYFFPSTRLRSIIGLKAGIVALMWTCMTCLYPLLLRRLDYFDLHNFFYGYNGLMMAQRFFFLLPLCILFNVRDMEADRIAGIRTLPLVYGMRTTKIICLVSLFLFTAFLPYPFNIRSEVLVLSLVITGVLTVFAHPSRSEYFYSLWVDGMMMVQAGLVSLLAFSH